MQETCVQTYLKYVTASGMHVHATIESSNRTCSYQVIFLKITGKKNWTAKKHNITISLRGSFDLDLIRLYKVGCV